jgi:hypothetical protein
MIPTELIFPNFIAEAAPDALRSPWRYKTTFKKRVDSFFISRFFRHLLDGKDFLITAYGEKDVGKSQSMIQLARLICPDFTIEDDVVFTLEDFFGAMHDGKDKKWRVIVLDDFGTELNPKEVMETLAKITSEYMQVSRMFKTGYIITTPNKAFINKDTRDRLADYYIELKYKNVDANYSSGIIQQVQKNIKTDKTYYHNLYDLNGELNNQGMGVKVWDYHFYPLPKELQDVYVPLRRAKGERGLQRGIQYYADMKKGNKSIKDIADEVWADFDKYTKRTKAGKIQFRSAKIEEDMKIPYNKVLKVKSYLEDRVNEKEESL